MRAPHLGEQVALLVVDEEDVVLDPDLPPVLVQLPQAGDVGVQPRDVVHICQCPVLVV